MGRSGQRKKSLEKNCKRARKFLSETDSQFRRQQGSGVGGFSADYYQRYQTTDSISRSGAPSSHEAFTSSSDVKRRRDETHCLNVDDDDFNDLDESDTDDESDEETAIDSLFQDIESDNDEDDVSEDEYEDDDALYEQPYDALSSRSQRWRKAQFFSRIGSTIRDLLETGTKKLPKHLAVKSFLKHVLDSFEEDLKSILQGRLEKGCDEESATKLCRKFQSVPPRKKKRVEIASKLFDVFGNLLHFHTQKEAKIEIFYII